MLLYRIAPVGSWAVAESAADPRLRVLESDPFEVSPGDWQYGGEVPREGASLLPPVRPTKIVCVGRNYREHAKELDHPMPEEPLLFLKAPSSLIGPEETIVLPPESQRVEHEGEIALVIRRRLSRGATPEEARAAVLGAVCANDVTARDLQKKDAVFARSKSFDTFCAVGPAIWVGADLENLAVITRVNGAERQRGHVREMAFPLLDLLLYSSRMMTLLPGDLLLSGTPAGVGPLLEGDRVEVEIPGLGVLANPVAAWRG
ncbi:MAG TPA: fumarylacetoacetate hydrolase family protein [Thermoanaerobaculia bacterium]|nr:fumarylacetoacetate hydrolase family protein [Thermoanaerobaculia bacterium]